MPAQMAMSGQFKWDPVHQMAWNCIKFLACLGFELHVIDKKLPIYYTCDSSQISVAYIGFQVIDGEIKVTSMDSKILKSADRNKPAAFRETLALMFTLMSNESIIRAHLGKVLILTDCIGLLYITY